MPDNLMLGLKPIDPTLYDGKPLALPIDDAFLMRLAHECARDVYPLDDILTLFKLDENYFEEYIRNHPIFMRYFAEAAQMWGAASNFKERSALKAGILFEEWLTECNVLLHDREQPLAAKVTLGQMLARISGVEKEKGAGVQAGERVIVNIDLSARGPAGPVIHIDKVAPTPPTIEGTVSFMPPPPPPMTGQTLPPGVNPTSVIPRNENNFTAGRTFAQDIEKK